MTAKLPEKILTAVELLKDKKAEDIKVYDLTEQAAVTDYFIFCTGMSDTQVKAIAEHVENEMEYEGERAVFKEGYTEGRWVILDFIDFVIHVFLPAVREYYRIDHIWGDCIIQNEN